VRRLTYLIALALSVMMILAPNAGAQENETVYIRDFHFSPSTITVEPGTKVTWVNRGQAPHTVTHTGGAFDSGTLQQGQSYSHTFNQPGGYAYSCLIHPNMAASVVVGGRGGAAVSESSPTATATATASAMASMLKDTGGPPMVPAVILAASLVLIISSLAMRIVLRRNVS
jgi:plastocyanin